MYMSSSLKQERMHKEMKTYLDLREKEKENSSVEVQTRISTSFMKMSTSFANSARANDCFQQLHQMKDKTVFKLLHELLNEYSSSSAIKSVRSALLERIGKKHPNFELFNTLSLKISYSIFNAEHVYNIFEGVVSRDDDKSTLCALDLLLILLSKFPELVRGSEQHLLKLLTYERAHSSETLLQILAKACSHVSVNLSDVYPFLELLCLEGKRNQSKHAVSAICALWDGSDKINISGLYEKLLESLHSGNNLPTILQSLGCLSICSLTTFELYQEQVTEFLYGKLFCSEEVDLPSEATSLIDEQCSTSCKLKIYVLKALAKCYMPKQAADVKHQTKKFLHCLLDIIQGKDIMRSLSSSESDRGHLRLAAAKSVLQLAKRWDSHISPIFFRLTVMVARDPSSAVRKAFLSKIHRLLKEHAIPSRYAIAFALATSDTLAEIRKDSLQYLSEFLKEHRKEVFLLHQNTLVHGKDGRNMTQYPEYIVVFLIHVLAHDKGFPSESCHEEDIYAEFCSPLIVALRALTDPAVAKVEENRINESQSYMLGIFRAIKKAEDAVDSQMTPRLHILSNIGFYTLKTSKYYKHSTQSAHLILLPSSFYKLRHEAGSLEIYSHNDSFIDEGFVMRVVSIVDAVAEPARSGSKKYRSSRRELQQLNATKSNSTHMLVGGRTDVSLDKMADSACGDSVVVVHQKVTSRRKEMKALPVCSLQSIKPAPTLANSKTMLEDTDDNLGKISNMEKEKSSSLCGSSSTKPSYPTPEFLLEEDNHTASTSLAARQGVIDNSGFGLESIETSKICSETSADRKRSADTGKLQVGQRIRLWSLQDKCFSSGIVDDSQSSDCQIIYDKREHFCLAHEKLDGINERPALEDKTNFYPKDCSFSRKHPISVSSTATVSENVQESNVWSVSSSGSPRDNVTSAGDDSQEPVANLEKTKEKLRSKRIISTAGTGVLINKRSLRSTTHEKNLEAEPVRRTRARRT